MTAVLDASAVLAFLNDEEGATVVEGRLVAGASCSAANWSEVAQKVRSNGHDWNLSRALLGSYELVIEPVTESDAEWAAARWTRGDALSLADRLCLALAVRLGATVWTADRAWGRAAPVRQIR